MDYPDLTNGLFECLGALAILGHIVRVLKDKTVAGVSIWAAAFFASWGVWNLWYYPHLDQWWSFYGTIAIVAGNVTWITLLMYFTKHPKPLEVEADAAVLSKRVVLRSRLTTAQGHYVALLEGELEEVVPLANSCGWTSARFRTGEMLRGRIAELKLELGVPD